MGRWIPEGRARLQHAALELFIERGFERTTVAEIAGRAGLTERTFFRHFIDKREVLFAGADQLNEVLTGAVADAPVGTPPIDAVREALVAVGTYIQENREFSQRRQAVIDAHAELRERELIKLASWGATLAAALRARNVASTAATLTAEAGVAAFKVAFANWIHGTGERTLVEHIAQSFDELKALAAGR